MLTIQKFGGSSLADIDKLRRAAYRCIEAVQNGQKVVMVVSAMGDTTDDLAELAYEINPDPPKRESDALLTSGEQQSAALMAIMLDSLGTRAISLTGWQSGIFTDSVFGDASPEVTFPNRIEEALESDVVPVITGFQGVDITGNITSLGRGGSDTTAVLLAAALKADRCEIYTDVDGIYTADPRLIKDAKRIAVIDYRDMLTLSMEGSQVLHHKSVTLAMINGVNIHLLPAGRRGGGSIVTALSDNERPALAGVTKNELTGEVSLVGKSCCAELLPQTVLELADSGVRVCGGGVRNNCLYLVTDKSQLAIAAQLLHDMYF